IRSGFWHLIAWKENISVGIYERINLLFNPIALEGNYTPVERNLSRLNEGMQYAKRHFTGIQTSCL
ncbi:protein mxiK, partial [Shigella sonnei]|nr:protein mxiK [Shigella sonnei]